MSHGTLNAKNSEAAIAAQRRDPHIVARMLCDRYRGRFMVMWSEWSNLFVAWATWIGGGGVLIEEPDPQQLVRLMNGQLEQYRIPLP